MTRFFQLMAACLLGLATVVAGLAPANALPMGRGSAGIVETDILPVYHRGYRHRPPVYHHRRYYRPRVYIAPQIIYRDPYIRRGGNAHVRWCLSRYRSYNPATNRYLAYAGVYKVCRSPYR